MPRVARSYVGVHALVFTAVGRTREEAWQGDPARCRLFTESTIDSSSIESAVMVSSSTTEAMPSCSAWRVEVWVQLGGTTLSVWEMRAIQEASREGKEVPPTYINVTDAVSAFSSISVWG